MHSTAAKYRRRREPQSALLRLERNFANYSAILPPLKSSLRFVRILKAAIDRILFCDPSAPARLRRVRPSPGPSLQRCKKAPLGSVHVRFSNRPFGVKRFQTIHRCSVDVAHGLVLLFGIGTRALVWGFLSQAG